MINEAQKTFFKNRRKKRFNCIEDRIKQFEEDYIEYVNASIVHAEVQEVYKPIVFEDELEWIKEYIKSNFK